LDTGKQENDTAIGYYASMDYGEIEVARLYKRTIILIVNGRLENITYLRRVVEAALTTIDDYQMMRRVINHHLSVFTRIRSHDRRRRLIFIWTKP
jgi:hypothetical protein